VQRFVGSPQIVTRYRFRQQKRQARRRAIIQPFSTEPDNDEQRLRRAAHVSDKSRAVFAKFSISEVDPTAEFTRPRGGGHVELIKLLEKQAPAARVQRFVMRAVQSSYFK